jgi:uncharacterized protein
VISDWSISDWEKPMNFEEKVNRVSEYVRDYIFQAASKREDDTDPNYRWLHTLRVTNIGKHLAEEEGGDMETVIIACLLHDIAWFDDPINHREHGRNGARLVRPLLAELAYSEEEINAICYPIAAHVDDKADFDHPHTLEAMIVSDADNIDRFDAYRILLYCKPEIYDFKALVEKLKDRLVTLKDYRARRIMGTDTGHRLWNQKLEQQISFYEAILTQNEISSLPDF